MKTKIMVLTICLALLGVSTSAKVKDGSALTGNSLTYFGKYTVVKSTVPMVVGDNEVPTYNLTYENTNEVVHIGLVKEKNCTRFIVRTDIFEVQYSCNKGVFGVKKLEKRFQEIPKEETEAKLDRVNYLSQRVICLNKKSESELLGLIACYFPALINEKYQANF